MNTEEKAKAYDEAIERAKKHLSIKAHPANNVVEYIFPELCESEDEKVRKEIISFIQDHIDEINLQVSGDYDTRDKEDIALQEWCKRAITWLEKQGEQKSVDKEYTFKSIPRLLDMIEPSDRAKAYCQKLIDTLAKEGYSTDAKIVGECLKQMNGEKVAMATMDEQKPTDNVEPKFKNGQWIVWQNKCYKVNYNGCGYGLIDQNGLSTSLEYGTVDKSASAFTIKDAKDGDVLVNGSNIFIFHFINGTRLKGYCHVNTDNGIFYDDIGKNECFCLIDAVVNPATKEQRDTLLKAMADAGYTFDFESKELKKIEHKSTDRREPKFKVGDWVTNGIETVQITGYDIDYGYQVDYKGKLQHRDTDIIEKEYHLWTIQDVKHDDVLVVNWDNGYKLDDEKKELKKLSQRMISAEAKEALYDKPTDEEMKELLRTEYEKGIADTIAEMYVPTQISPEESLGVSSEKYMAIVDTLTQGGQKPAKWSLEDERVIAIINNALTESNTPPDDYDKVYDWLESLRQKIGG